MAIVNHKPELIIIAGPNGSGKTSVTQRFLHHKWAEGTIYINPDEIAKDKFGDWNNSDAVLKAANYCAELREQCLKARRSFVFETVFSAQDKLNFVIQAKEAGFFIRIFFISTSNPAINASRIAKRVMKGGHDVPISKIITRYYKSIRNCKAISSIVDRLYIYDNSIEDNDARPLFRLSDGMLPKYILTIFPNGQQRYFRTVNNHKPTHSLSDTQIFAVPDNFFSEKICVCRKSVIPLRCISTL